MQGYGMPGANGMPQMSPPQMPYPGPQFTGQMGQNEPNMQNVHNGTYQARATEMALSMMSGMFPQMAPGFGGVAAAAKAAATGNEPAGGSAAVAPSPFAQARPDALALWETKLKHVDELAERLGKLSTSFQRRRSRSTSTPRPRRHSSGRRPSPDSRSRRPSPDSRSLRSLPLRRDRSSSGSPARRGGRLADTGARASAAAGEGAAVPTLAGRSPLPRRAPSFARVDGVTGSSASTLSDVEKMAYAAGMVLVLLGLDTIENPIIPHPPTVDVIPWCAAVAGLTNMKDLDLVCKSHNLPMRFEAKPIKVKRILQFALDQV
jgi:hypothetical protein